MQQHFIDKLSITYISFLEEKIFKKNQNVLYTNKYTTEKKKQNVNHRKNRHRTFLAKFLQSLGSGSKFFPPGSEPGPKLFFDRDRNILTIP